MDMLCGWTVNVNGLCGWVVWTGCGNRLYVQTVWMGSVDEQLEQLEWTV